MVRGDTYPSWEIINKKRKEKVKQRAQKKSRAKSTRKENEPSWLATCLPAGHFILAEHSVKFYKESKQVKVMHHKIQLSKSSVLLE